MLYIDFDDALKLHDEIIELSGGLKGYDKTRVGYLKSALTQIQNDIYYPTFEAKLAHLMFSCVKFHPFSDGNKRTSILLGSYFLGLNNYCLDNFFEKMEDVVVKLAENEINKDEFERILHQFLIKNNKR